MTKDVHPPPEGAQRRTWAFFHTLLAIVERGLVSGPEKVTSYHLTGTRRMQTIWRSKFSVDKLGQDLYILIRIIVNSYGALIMQTLSLSEVKMKLSELVDRVHSTDEEVVITKNGRPAAVLVSPGEFESWKETIEILSSDDLMDEIRKGLAALRKGGKIYTLEELLE